MEKHSFETIDQYIDSFTGDVREILQKIRKVVREDAPEASESINYGIPTFKLAGNLVHFAAYKNHIGFYPAPSGMEEFKKEVATYKTGKGTLQFPLDKPIPYELISKIVQFRVEEIKQKATKKKND
ncbi:iron chaperone [Aquiflexum sp.]|uniref:iron chaperone n=1 Tax=Aquiflexum sp. TaxID=1872584 RepID=UPI003593F613